MIDKLDAIRARFDELGVALTNPAVVNDNRKFSSTSKEYRSLEKIVKSYDHYINVLEDLAFNREALNGDDEELRELAQNGNIGFGGEKTCFGGRHPADVDPQRSTRRKKCDY